MNLLITTQKVDMLDDNLGFFHDWILEFARHCEKVTVICLNEGKHEFPGNVLVLGLGKEKISNFQFPIFNRIKFIIRFYRYIWRYRKEYDSVFVHMNSEYAVLGGLFWKMLNKRLAVWFTHGSVPPTLWIAEKIVDVIFTASKASCPIGGRKVKVVGHGIDVDKFKILNFKFQNNFKLLNDKKKNFKIITVGRISPSKDYETLIGAVEILRMKEIDNILVEIVGGAGTLAQEEYFSGLKKTVIDKGLQDVIKFVGPIPALNVPEKLAEADLFVHMSQTGSLDKAVLEAMASSVVVVSNNKAVKEDLIPQYADELCYDIRDAKGLAERIENVVQWDAQKRLAVGRELRQVIERGHGLPGLVKKIIGLMI